jgi:hypothetical protein
VLLEELDTLTMLSIELMFEPGGVVNPFDGGQQGGSGVRGERLMVAVRPVQVRGLLAGQGLEVGGQRVAVPPDPTQAHPGGKATALKHRVGQRLHAVDAPPEQAGADQHDAEAGDRLGLGPARGAGIAADLRNTDRGPAKQYLCGSHAKVCYVDYRDVAEVAAAAMTGTDLSYGTFELCAPGMVTRIDIAQMMSDAAGRRIEAAEVDFDQWADAAKISDGPMRDGFERMYAKYDQYGFAGGNALILRSILGREPRTLRAYIEELASP